MTDSDLTAFVHGELDARRTSELQKQVAADASLRARVDALRAADRALLDALDTAEAPPRVRATNAWWRQLVAVAALFVLAAVFVMMRGDPAFARNDIVSLRASVHGGVSQPIFTDVALDLSWQKQLDGPHWLHVRPYRFGDTPETVGREQLKSPEVLGKIVPLLVSATLHAPDGSRIAARLDADSEAFRETADQRVLLRQFTIEAGTPPPYLGGRPGERRWIEDFRWAFAEMPADGPRRLLLDQAGEWTIELRVESAVPPEPGLWPTFTEPLVAAVKIIATGIVSDWGPEHDGLRARFVLATGCTDLDHAPLVLQIQNVGERQRRYNVIGMTQAKVPQPFHFDLLAGNDAEPGQQRDGLAVVIPHDALMVPHPAGTVRSLIVCADYWRFGERRLTDIPGEITLRVRFHFEAFVWVGTDTELWQGALTTGAVRVPR